MQHEGDPWNALQRRSKGAGRVEILETSLDHPNYNIVEVCQNTEKNHGDKRKLAFTQIIEKDHRLILV